MRWSRGPCGCAPDREVTASLDHRSRPVWQAGSARRPCLSDLGRLEAALRSTGPLGQNFARCRPPALGGKATCSWGKSRPGPGPRPVTPCKLPSAGRSTAPAAAAIGRRVRGACTCQRVWAAVPRVAGKLKRAARPLEPSRAWTLQLPRWARTRARIRAGGAAGGLGRPPRDSPRCPVRTPSLESRGGRGAHGEPPGSRQLPARLQSDLLLQEV